MLAKRMFMRAGFLIPLFLLSLVYSLAGASLVPKVKVPAPVKDCSCVIFFTIGSGEHKLPEISFEQVRAIVTVTNAKRGYRDDKKAAVDIRQNTVSVLMGDVQDNADALRKTIMAECRKFGQIRCVFLCFGDKAANVVNAMGQIEGAVFDTAIYVAAQEKEAELTSIYWPPAKVAAATEHEQKIATSHSEPALSTISDSRLTHQPAHGWWGNFKATMSSSASYAYDLTRAAVSKAKSYALGDSTISVYPLNIENVYCLRTDPFATTYGQSRDVHGFAKIHNICVFNEQGKSYNLYSSGMVASLPRLMERVNQYRLNYDFIAFVYPRFDVRLIIYRFTSFDEKTSQLIGFNEERFGHRITLQFARTIFAAEYKASDCTIDHMQHEEPAVDVRFLLADLRLMHRRLAPEILKP